MARGDGSVYQRRDGRWEGSVYLGKRPDGRPNRPVVRGRSKREVQNKLRDLRALHAKGDATGRTLLSARLSDYLPLYLEHLARYARPQSVRVYESIFRNHVLPALGSEKIFDISVDPDILQRHFDSLPLSPHSIRTVRTYLSAAFNHAVRKGYIPRNPVRYTDAPHTERREIVWTLQDVRAFLEAAKGAPLEAFCSVALSLGLRKGEALALQWQDVELDKGVIYIRSTLTRIKGVGLVHSPPKTRNSLRTVHVPSAILVTLRAHRKAQLEFRMAHYPTYTGDYVFATVKGTPLDPSHVNVTFNALCQQAELPRIRVHDMRHLAASLMIAQGVPLEVVSKVLGHASISITSQLYSHLLEEHLIETAAKVDTFFSQGSTEAGYGLTHNR